MQYDCTADYSVLGLPLHTSLTIPPQVFCSRHNLCFHCPKTDIGFRPVLLSYNSCICLSWMKALPAVKYLNKFFTVKSIVINKLKHNKKISYLHRIFVISSFYYPVPVKIKILGPKVCMIYQPVKEKNPLLLILQCNRRIRPFCRSISKQISWCSDFGVP